MSKPTLKDIQTSKYQAGDRVIVRVGQAVNSDQRRVLEKAVSSYAGVDLNLLIVECHLTEIVLIRNDKPLLLLAGLDHIRNTPMTNQVNLGGSKVELLPLDVLEVYTRHTVGSAGGHACINMVQQWSGYDVAVRQMPWRF